MAQIQERTNELSSLQPQKLLAYIAALLEDLIETNKAETAKITEGLLILMAGPISVEVKNFDDINGPINVEVMNFQDIKQFWSCTGRSWIILFPHRLIIFRYSIALVSYYQRI